MAVEKKLKDKEEELASAHAELVKLRSDKEDVIDEYMGSEKYKDLMEIHDEGLYPTQFTFRWDKAMEAILDNYHGMFHLKDFVSPEQPMIGDDSERKLNLLCSRIAFSIQKNPIFVALLKRWKNLGPRGMTKKPLGRSSYFSHALLFFVLIFYKLVTSHSCPFRVLFKFPFCLSYFS